MNTVLNIGCSKYCLIESGFTCPADNSYTNGDGRSGLLCTDRCHDGEYDGKYTQVGRDIDQRSWPYRSNSVEALAGQTRKSALAISGDVYNTGTGDSITNQRLAEE